MTHQGYNVFALTTAADQNQYQQYPSCQRDNLKNISKFHISPIHECYGEKELIQFWVIYHF